MYSLARSACDWSCEIVLMLNLGVGIGDHMFPRDGAGASGQFRRLLCVWDETRTASKANRQAVCPGMKNRGCIQRIIGSPRRLNTPSRAYASRVSGLQIRQARRSRMIVFRL